MIDPLLLPYPPRSFFVASALGRKMRNNHGSCGKKVATLNAVLMLCPRRRFLPKKETPPPRPTTMTTKKVPPNRRCCRTRSSVRRSTRWPRRRRAKARARGVGGPASANAAALGGRMRMTMARMMPTTQGTLSRPRGATFCKLHTIGHYYFVTRSNNSINNILFSIFSLCERLVCLSVT